MSELIYVDNSSVFIEGERVSAVARVLAVNIFSAMNSQILDGSYRLDFGRLHEFVAGQEKIKRCMLFGSKPPPKDSLWAAARRAGFEIVVEDRNIANKEKKIDTGIVAEMMRDGYTVAEKENDTITLVAGDSDYVPAIRPLVNDGFRAEVAFWNHASQELKNASSTFIGLDDYLNHLAYRPHD